MSWENRIVWGEGLFLQPQHLQQQERYFDRLVRTSTGPLRPFAWGLTELDLDKDLLTLGKFAIRNAAGILPDGTPFSVPDQDDHPRAIDLPEATRNSIVYLMLPTRQPGAVEAAGPEHTETVARFVTAEHEAADSNAGYQSTATLPIGKLRLRYAVEGEARAGFASLGLARVIEVRADRSVVLDESFIPPVLASECVRRARRVSQPDRGAAAPPRGIARRARIGNRDARGRRAVGLPVAAAVQPLRAAAHASVGHRGPAASRDVLQRRRSASPGSWPPSPKAANVRWCSRPTATTTCTRRSVR